MQQMLYFLTGDIQTGKTRWLEGLVGSLEAEGVTVFGVVAPGTWVEHRAEDGSASFEKTGILNELLPSHERIAFGRRPDLAAGDVPADQARRAGLGWVIADDAIARVNAHFDGLAESLAGSAPCAGGSSRNRGHDAPAPASVLRGRGLLVVDELGRLELLRDEGLVSAVKLLEAGATEAVPHALVVVREQLVDQARERFASAPWGGMRAIVPGDAALGELIGACRPAR